MPDPVKPTFRLPLDLSRGVVECFVLTSLQLSTLLRWFTFVRLLPAYLTGFIPPFPQTLTTPALNECSSGWFGITAWSAKPRGRPSSRIQHVQRRTVAFLLGTPTSILTRGARSNA